MSGVLGPFDFTAHFAANFPAADSATLALSVYFDITTGTGLTTNNISALIAVTYEYDDGAATQYATAVIPMESLVGAMGTTDTNRKVAFLGGRTAVRLDTSREAVLLGGRTVEVV